MKKILLLALIALSMNAAAQKKDTVVKKEPTYVLIGNLNDFQLLFTAVTRPGDVTPNQVSALAAWLQKLQALPDTLKKEPPKKQP